MLMLSVGTQPPPQHCPACTACQHRGFGSGSCQGEEEFPWARAGRFARARCPLLHMALGAGRATEPFISCLVVPHTAGEGMCVGS